MTYYERIKSLPIKEDAIILGIETSCDETAVAIVKGGKKILADQIISSSSEHVKFGGVVPEIASRYHTEAILIATENALKQANLTIKEIDAIAVTYGAGLLGALLVGVSFAKALAFAHNKPLVPVSHIRGHLSAGYLADENLKPPFISALDDAVGEAFDKVARVIGLKYPGGPNIEKLAKEGKNSIVLPKMLKGYQGSPYVFSYSGLKTAVINYVHNNKERGVEINRADVAKSFECSAIDVLVEKAIKAVKETGAKTITVSGGVGANAYLRERLKEEAERLNVKLVLPEKRYCTDNGAMIGAEGYLQYLKGNFADLTLNAQAVVPFN